MRRAFPPQNAAASDALTPAGSSLSAVESQRSKPPARFTTGQSDPNSKRSAPNVAKA